MKRGTCANRQSLREDTARVAVLGELRHQLVRPAGVSYIRREVARRLGESFRGIGAELTKVQQTIGKLDTQIEYEAHNCQPYSPPFSIQAEAKHRRNGGPSECLVENDHQIRE